MYFVARDFMVGTVQKEQLCQEFQIIELLFSLSL